MKIGLYVIVRDTEAPIRFDDLERVIKIDKELRFNLYSKDGELILNNVDFETLKQNV